MKIHRIGASFALAILALATAHLVSAQSAPRNEPILPLPDSVTDVEPAQVKLGERLFADKRFSGDGTVSCQSCHLPHAGMADPRRHSVSAFGKVRELNSPTLLNIRYNTAGLNWTGRTKDLDAQINGSIGNADTMAHDWEKVIQVLAADPISAREKAGYDKFKSYGCVGCHNGINVGGNTFMKFSPVGDYFADRAKRGRGAMVDVDKGRFLVTKKEEDMHVFRVPPLRNVALTAPYFHDGAVESLDEAILLMGRHQLGREIPAADRGEIEAFLKSLTGKALERR